MGLKERGAEGGEERGEVEQGVIEPIEIRYFVCSVHSSSRLCTTLSIAFFSEAKLTSFPYGADSCGDIEHVFYPTHTHGKFP